MNEIKYKTWFSFIHVDHISQLKLYYISHQQLLKPFRGCKKKAADTNLIRKTLNMRITRVKISNDKYTIYWYWKSIYFFKILQTQMNLTGKQVSEDISTCNCDTKGFFYFYRTLCKMVFISKLQCNSIFDHSQTRYSLIVLVIWTLLISGMNIVNKQITHWCSHLY